MNHPQRLPLILAALFLVCAPASPALAHGGRITQAPPGSAPPVKAPPPALPSGANRDNPALTATPTAGGGGSTARYDWQTWWEHNREVYLGFRPLLHDAPPAPRPSNQTAPVTGPADSRKVVRDEIVPALLAATGDRSHEVRSSAYLALGKTGVADVRQAIEAGLDDGHSQVREASALALGLLAASDTLPSLRGIARPAASGVISGALIRRRAFATLAMGFAPEDETLEALRDLLGRREATHDVHAAAVLALGATGGDGVLPLIRAISPRSRLPAEVRAFAAIALGKSGNPGVARPLLAALQDQSQDVRASAALALGGFAPRPATAQREIDEIRRRLDSDVTAVLSPRARFVLGERLAALEQEVEEHDKEQEAIRSLVIRRLHAVASGKRARGTPAARNFAAISIGRLGGEESLRALAHLLRTVKPANLRCFVCLALGLAGRGRNDDSVPRLLARTFRGARSVDLRGASAIALGIVGDPAAGRFVAERLARVKDKELRAQLALSLGMLRHRASAAELLRLVREEEHVNLRRNAALALGLMRDETAIDTLVKVLRQSKGRLIQGSAALALGSIGDRRAVPPLIALLRNRRAPDLSRAFAAVALGILAEGRTVPRLAEFAANNNYLVPVASVQEAFDIL